METIKDTGKTKEQLLEIVYQEYLVSKNFTEQKREHFKNTYRYLLDKNGKKGKVNYNLILTAIKQMMAVSYSDQLTIEFEAREIGDEIMAENWNDIAKFDYDEMALDAMKYEVGFDRYFYGVGIRYFDNWQKDRNHPVFTRISPMSWFPDPKGYLTPDRFRFMGFEVSISPRQLTDEGGYFNLKNIKNDLVMESQDQIDTDNQRACAFGYNPQCNVHNENKLTTVYHHLTRIDGQPWIISVVNGIQEIIRVEKVKAADKAESNNPELIPFPVALNYYEPMEGDPFGNSIPDHLLDKQKALSVLSNLRLIRERIASVGSDILYNAEAIRNTAHLSQTSRGKKYIPVNGDVQGAMRELPMPKVNPDSFNVQQDLERQGSIETGSSPLRSGVVGEERRTAEEIRTARTNSDLISLLNQKVDAMGERTFWKLWMRSYRLYMPPTAKKIIRVSGHFKNSVLELKGKDFITLSDPDIRIDLKSNIQQNLTEFLASYPVLYQQAKTNIAKSYLQRLYAKRIGLTRDEVNLFCPPSIEEAQALQDIELINNDIFPEILDPNEDHQTYIVLYQQAIDNDTKFKAIEARKNAYIMSGQNQNSLVDPQLEQQASAIQQATFTNQASQQK